MKMDAAHLAYDSNDEILSLLSEDFEDFVYSPKKKQ